MSLLNILSFKSVITLFALLIFQTSSLADSLITVDQCEMHFDDSFEIYEDDETLEFFKKEEFIPKKFVFFKNETFIDQYLELGFSAVDHVEAKGISLTRLRNNHVEPHLVTELIFIEFKTERALANVLDKEDILKVLRSCINRPELEKFLATYNPLPG